MVLKIYNTFTRKKEEFIPITKGKVGLYCCGPTVYNYAHIGNLRSYIFEDILRRVLEYDAYKVKHVVNITDVGHLTSDADTGEDKLLVGAKREKKTIEELAKFYTDAFMNDIERLNIKIPHKLPEATAHIKEQIEMIQILEEKGYTYQAGGNVYFDTSKFKDYGKLAKLDLEKEGKARVEKDPNKKNSRDFVLWFTKSKFQDQEMKWDSPWGVGYPGWHLECSAMSSKYLGEHFDIHCGGVDHIPVHHTNEIAQSEAAYGGKWVNYWLHGEFLVMDRSKMSKSTGSFTTLQTIIDKGYDPLDYRYFTLTAHYRTQLNFSWEALDSAKNSYAKLKNAVLALQSENSSNGSIDKYKSNFILAINDDLNMPNALAILWDVVRTKDLGSKEKLELIYDFDRVFGLKLKDIKKDKVPSEIKKLVDKREEARKQKDWAESDKLRDEIRAKGWDIQDTARGPEVRKDKNDN